MSRVQGSGFKVQGFGFRVLGFGFRVSGFEFRVSRMYRECIECKEGADEVGSTGTAPDLASADFLQMNKV